MRNTGIRRFIGATILVFLLLSAFGLRVWGSGYGLPAYTRYHPDEHALVERAAKILWTGDWNLERFNYPPAYAYVQATGYALYFLYGVTQDLWQHLPEFVLPNYYQVGRLLTAAFGTLTVLVVYLIGRQLKNRRAGLLAAALLGGNYLHIIHSHYATFDVMVGFWAALTLLFSELLGENAKAKWYFWAGLCAGLAGATKYNGAVAIILPILAHVLSTKWGKWGWLNGPLVLSLGAFLVGFFGGNPFAIGNLPDFLNGLATVLHHYGTQHPGFEGRANWRWYPSIFLRSADAPWVIGGTLGLVDLLLKEWKKGLLLVAFPAIYYLMVSRFIVRFERNMVPLMPFLAIGGGWFIDRCADLLARRAKRAQAATSIVAVTGAVLLLCLSVPASVALDRALTETDHREHAGQWVEDNITAGSKIALEHYGIPFDYDRYRVEDVIRADDHDLDWYQQQGFDFLIISDGVWEILSRQPEIYADKLGKLHDLTRSSRLMAEFVPEPAGIVIAGYPTVEVYHFAPVRIYQLPKSDNP